MQSSRSRRFRIHPLPSVAGLLLLSLISCSLTSCTGEKGAPAPQNPTVVPEITATDPEQISSIPDDEIDPWFIDVTHSSGIDFVYRSFEDGDRQMPAIMGAGVALFDADADGDLDLYLVQGNNQLPAKTKQAGNPNRFFRQDAPWSFVDATASSGLGDGGYGIGATTGDFDGDGYTDLYVSNYGPDVLYRNLGDGTFEDVTASAGIDIDGFTVSCAFADIDRDGDLDLWVTQYVEFLDTLDCFSASGQPEFCGPEAFKPSHDILLRNDGDGTFTDISEAAGLHAVAAASLGICCVDYNEDGWIDFYIANDAYENNLWINQKDGTFVDDAAILGASLNLNGQEEAGMGVVASDLDGDGSNDLLVTHLDMESNTFYRNLGSQMGFVDASGQSGLGPSSMKYTGFGVVAFDIELDGDNDILIANGRVRIGDEHPGTDSPPPWNQYSEPNLCYINDGSGSFEDGKSRGGEFCTAIDSSRGLTCGDIDGDGDLDVIVSNIEGAARLYRNDAERKGSWLKVRALDGEKKRILQGAIIGTHDGDRPLIATVSTASSYASAIPEEVHFGAVQPSDTLTVIWPSGLREEFEIGGWNRTIEVHHGGGKKVE